MIDAIIFDFGNVFINLDIENGFKESLQQLGVHTLSEDIISINESYEIGEVSTESFINFYAEKFTHLSNNQLIDLWNIILKDFPKYRLDFLKKLKAQNKYKLILLSNTNELHINWIKENVSFYEDFKNCFDVFYLSHEINLRKPNAEIFEFVLDENRIQPEKCLFIDDNADNIATAKTLDIKTWHITLYNEDVVDLFSSYKHLF